MGAVRLRKGRDGRARSGHPWVYQGEVSDVVGNPRDGDIVDVESATGAFIGRGYMNRISQIIVRILTWKNEPVDEFWFRAKLAEAFRYRQIVAPGVGSVRLVHSEGDSLPGLVIDRYGDCLVFQILTLGMEERRDLLLREALEISGLERAYERSDVRSREHEGLAQRCGFMTEPFDTGVDVIENGFAFRIDIAHGQKTGHFLDQRENRASMAPYCDNARVLDCFCHTGAFAVHAAGYGAMETVGIDISTRAVEDARSNAERNGLGGRSSFVAGNAFDLLRETSVEVTKGQREPYDVVILDPPAFAKSRSAAEAAARGYKEINLRACKALREGGFLITSSCSHHVDEGAFISIVESAIADAGRRARLVEVRTQSRDHPIMVGVPETKYLKFLVLQVM
ncbi:MAG: class I SAM-dependent rRNA methyltransferase [Clostridia bacterium]|nr:class I SAM-dependent rRNA methyltransferase [Clostridia bacterium]